ncbi:MAG: hypothetical protein WCO79_02805 [bacterium]
MHYPCEHMNIGSNATLYGAFVASRKDTDSPFYSVAMCVNPYCNQ